MQFKYLASILMSSVVLSGQAGLAAPPDCKVEATAVPVLQSYGQIPLGFEANQGQTGDEVKFFARGSGYGLWLTPTEAVLALHRRVSVGSSGEGRVIRLGWTGANPVPRVTGHEQLPGASHYLADRDPRQWRTHVAAYSRVHYGQVYPGIDLVWYGNQGELEYDWVVEAHANPGLIKLKVAGADRLEVDAQGDLVLHVGNETLKQRKPLIYQQVNGQRRRVAGGYVLRDQNVGLWVADYERSLPLVIDPVLAYSTYLGGNRDELGQGIAVDASGNAYVTGATPSLNFPTTTGVLQADSGGNLDAFVTRLNTTGSALVYSTYLGGENDDLGLDIALSGSGDAYVVGQTFSANFPTTPGAYQTAPGSDSDVFVARLDATGSVLVYSTYLGTDSFDVGLGIAVDSVGNARVTGYTTGDFPTTPGAVQQTYGGGAFDAFVSAFSATGALVYSTYLGGGSNDIGLGVAVDPSGNTYVTGVTPSTDFPTTSGAYQPVLGGGFDAFVSAFNTTGTFVYSTYLGGTGNDDGRGVAVDSSGNAHVTGFTSEGGFPITVGAFQTMPAGAQDAFVTKLNRTGSALVYSTYLGGSGNEVGFGIALDLSGNAYVTGYTPSLDFPVTNGAFQATLGGSFDAFVTGLSATGASLVYSTYLGGAGDDFGNGVAVGPAGNVHVVGITFADDFPTTTRAFQTNSGGLQDAFVTRLGVRRVPGR